MCNVLLVTCNSDTSSTKLRHAACDAIATIGRIDRNYSLRERHLYEGAVPEGCDARGKGKDKACIDLMLQEVRVADVLVIAAPIDNGRLPPELSAWVAKLGLSARLPTRDVQDAPHKVAIMIADRTGEIESDEGRLAELCEALRNLLAPLGISDVAVFEADAEGYPIRHAPLLLIVSRSSAIH